MSIGRLRCSSGFEPQWLVSEPPIHCVPVITEAIADAPGPAGVSETSASCPRPMHLHMKYLHVKVMSNDSLRGRT
jgi:hypothetical protein